MNDAITVSMGRYKNKSEELEFIFFKVKYLKYNCNKLYYLNLKRVHFEIILINLIGMLLESFVFGSL